MFPPEPGVEVDRSAPLHPSITDQRTRSYQEIIFTRKEWHQPVYSVLKKAAG